MPEPNGAKVEACHSLYLKFFMGLCRLGRIYEIYVSTYIYIYIHTSISGYVATICLHALVLSLPVYCIHHPHGQATVLPSPNERRSRFGPAYFMGFRFELLLLPG